MLYKAFFQLAVVWLVTMCMALGLGVVLTLAYLNLSIVSTLGVL